MRYDYGNILHFFVTNHAGGEVLPTPAQLTAFLTHSAISPWRTLEKDKVVRAVEAVLDFGASMTPASHACIRYTTRDNVRYAQWDRRVVLRVRDPDLRKMIKKDDVACWSHGEIARRRVSTTTPATTATSSVACDLLDDWVEIEQECRQGERVDRPALVRAGVECLAVPTAPAREKVARTTTGRVLDSGAWLPPPTNFAASASASTASIPSSQLPSRIVDTSQPPSPAVGSLQLPWPRIDLSQPRSHSLDFSQPAPDTVGSLLQPPLLTTCTPPRTAYSLSMATRGGTVAEDHEAGPSMPGSFNNGEDGVEQARNAVWKETIQMEGLELTQRHSTERKTGFTGLDSGAQGSQPQPGEWRAELDGRQAELDRRQAELEGRKAELDRWEAKLLKREAGSDGRDAVLKGWERRLKGRKEEVDAKEHGLEGWRKEVKGLEARVQQRQGSLDARSARVRQGWARVQQWKQELSAWKQRVEAVFHAHHLAVRAAAR